MEYTSIIDADSIVWMTAYIHKEDPTSIEKNLDLFLNEMLTSLGVSHYIGFLGGQSPNERRLKFSSYKSNRPARPEFYTQNAPRIERHLVDTWKYKVVEGIEADDACSIMAASLRKEKKDYVICGVDKDLKQIPGTHYNYKTKESIIVGTSEADDSLYLQLLTGDSTDSIPGLPGVGPVKARKILSEASTIRTGAEIPVTIENPDYIKVVQAYCKQLGVREGLSLFSETYLLIRLAEKQLSDFTVIPYLRPTPIER